MKDIKSSLGGSTYPADENPGALKAIVVRSKGAYGRRVGILTENDTILAGSKLHAADYRHQPTPVTQLPAGFTNGVVVELAPERIYHTAFTFQNTLPFEAFSGEVRCQMSDVISLGISEDGENVGYDPSARDAFFKADAMNLSSYAKGRNHVSFSLIYAGQTYHLGLEFTKHPAKITADLNYALANIHPNLRAIVALSTMVPVGSKSTWEIRIAVPAGVTIQLPRTDFVVESLVEQIPQAANYGSFVPMHLNNALVDGITLTNTGRTTYAMEPLPDPNISASKSVAFFVDERSVIGPQFSNDFDEWMVPFDIPAEKFHPYIHDPRYRIALIEVSPAYVKGDLSQLTHVKYGTDNSPADLLVVPRGYKDPDPTYGNQYGTHLIDIPASIAAGRFVGVTELAALMNDEEQYIPEHGGLNYNLADGDIYGSRLAVAVIAPSNAYNGFSPLFHVPTGTVPVELSIRRTASTPPVFKFEEDSEYQWDKSSDNKIPIKFKLSKVAGGVIKAVGASVWGLNITDSNPIITDAGDDWEIELNDGFSGRELTFGHSAGSISIGVSMTKGINGSAITRLGYNSALPYTVIVPVVQSEITLNNIPRFVVDPNNPDTVEFTGLVRTPSNPTNAEQKQPMYYAQGTNIDLFINGNPVVANVTKPAAGVDAVGTYKVSFTKGWLSTLGVGTHTLRVELDIELYWDGAKIDNAAEVVFEVLPEIEGTEDDITFIPAESFDQSPDTVSPMRIVDLDTGEVLAEGDTVNALIADATARGLVSAEAIVLSPITPIN